MAPARMPGQVQTPRNSMHTVPIAALALLFAPLVALQEDSQKLLKLEDTRSGGVRFRGETPGWKWAPDGVHLIEGKGKEARWVDPQTFERLSKPPEGADTKPEGILYKAYLVQAFEQLENVDAELAKKIVDAGPRTKSKDGTVRVYLHEGELFVYQGGSGVQRIPIDGQPELLALAPDGLHGAFVLANDLYVLDVVSGKVSPITSDGGENVFNGKLDWVYQEEIYGRHKFKGFWWSPDSKHIVFLRLDETDVHTFTVVDLVAKEHFRSESEITKYPKAGDANPLVAVGVAEVATGKIDWIGLDKYADVEPLVVRLGWTPDGDSVIYMVQDRIQTWLDLNAYALKNGKSETLIHEGSDSWTERLPEPRWMSDGSFLWQSDRTGYRHVYHYRPNGDLIGAVTSGPWQVGSIEWVDEERERLVFSGTKHGAINRNVYAVGLDGEGLVRLTPGEGTHTATFNADHTLLLDKYSSLTQPPRVQLCDMSGRVLRELARTEVPELGEYLTSEWELYEIAARDGYPLDVAVLKPVPFDESKTYPVWLYTYSGPDAPTIRNRWSPSTWLQFLAQKGIIVLNCNVRSASGKGLAATSTCYKQLGVQELKDLEDAVAWLTANPWADDARVGISGHSYGGFMTAYALTHSKDFELGVAGSGVYDWAMYDTIYTERYMSTPQENKDGYSATSVIETASDLSGHLVMTHGTQDDNVHVQNALQFAYALQKAGKDFEMMLYPETRHGIRDPDLRWFNQKLTWKAIKEHLLGDETTAP